MNRRIAAVMSSALVGAVVLTGCGVVQKAAKPTGMVVEREQELNSKGNAVYELTLTTDRKSIRRGVNKNKKTKSVKVSAKVYDSCSLKEMFPACK